MGSARPDALVLTAGADLLSCYVWNTLEAQHYFCRNCGIYTHHIMRGRSDRIGVNMACIEGVEVFALPGVEIDDFGRHFSLVGE